MHYLIIENAVSSELLADIRQAIADGPFADGRQTAGGLARRAKHNLQLAPARHAPLLERITQALREQPALLAFAMPRISACR
jgi:PKHD-type hydroxylase